MAENQHANGMSNAWKFTVVLSLVLAFYAVYGKQNQELFSKPEQQIITLLITRFS